MKQFLFSPTKQFQYASGKLLAGGKIYVYFKDTEDLAPLYNVDDSYQSNPIILDANGRASVKADDTYEYRLEVFSMEDVLQFTCNAFYAGDGGGSGGEFIVRHDETLSGNGTSQSLLGVVTIPLAVDDTMTAYEATIEETKALVLGVESDWFNRTFSGALSSKVDWETFSACCSAVKGGLENKLDASAYDLSNYYTKNETTYLLGNYVTTPTFNDSINILQNSKQDNLTFGYDNTVISSINNSAIGGGVSFPMSQTEQGMTYSVDVQPSAIFITTAAGIAGGTTKFTTKGVQVQAYPATNVSASWYNLIKGANVSSFKMTTAKADYEFTSDEIRHLSQINVTTPYDYYGPGTFSIKLGNKTYSGLDSACYYDFRRADVEGSENWVMCNTGYYSI